MQDQWTRGPRSPEELRAERAMSIASLDSLDIPLPRTAARTAARIREHGFTCDNCGRAPICTLAFDPYNTADDGSCLYDK